MSGRLHLTRYISALVGLIVIASHANGAPIGSPYRSAMDSLMPRHYLPLEEPADTGLGLTGATAANEGTAGAAFNGTYLTISGQTFAGTAAAQGLDANTFATIGRSVGPTVMSKFSNVAGNEITPATIAAQNPGFNPDYTDPADPSTAASINRVFEGNNRAAIRLGPTADYSGDPVSGAITVAGWFRSDDATTSGTARLYDAGAAAGTTNWFQITTGGTAGLTMAVGQNAADTKTLKAFYPSGTPAGSVGGDRGVGDSGQWYFIVGSTSGTTVAERAANLKIWERYAEKTNALGAPGTTLGSSNETQGGVRQAKFGYRDTTPAADGVPSGAQLNSGEMDELAIWNRVLQYDEMESLYVAATTPIAGATVNTSTADGNWTASANWTVGRYPLQHGGNQEGYYAAVIDHNVNAVQDAAIAADANGTVTFRSNMYSLAVNAAKTLSLGSGTTLRTYQDVNLSGNVAMNGAAGVFSSTAGTKDFNASRSANLEAGRDVNIAVGSSVTMASQSNQIRAEGNINFSSGSYTLSAYDNTGAFATGAHLTTVALADSNKGSGSLLQEGGVINNRFSTHTIPGNGGPIGDPLDRRVSILYENRAANGAGAVDAMKIGFARPGDLDYDSDVDFNDAFELTNNYGIPSGATWRQGDSDNDGDVDFTDAFEQTNYYGAAYSTTPGGPGDGVLTVLYDNTTGKLTIEGPAGEQYKSLSIESLSGLLIPGMAGWLGLPPGATNFTSDTPHQQGFATNTALGGSFLPQDGYMVGVLLPPSLPYDLLLQDLTIRYGVQGEIGTRIGNLVPEPSSVVLAILGIVGALGLAVRRRKAAAAA